MPTNTRHRIPRRIRARRQQLGLSQEDVARKAGFRHRQTVTAIEAGDRSISPEELSALAETLDVSVTFFTDRFIATGEAAFSFRAESDEGAELTDFEDLAGRWIATYRELEEERGRRRSLLLPALSLTAGSSFEDALAAAEDVRRSLGLGPYPGDELELALGRDWGIPVFYFDSRPGISGAASRFGGLQAIFINRSEPRGRRNFDLAHELFHLLTWDSMQPRRVDDSRPVREERRVERLANNFASALLMPESTVQEAWSRRSGGTPEDWIFPMASRFGVSGPALKWRLHNLGLVEKADLPSDDALRTSAGHVADGPIPLLFNVTLVERVHTAIESGVLSLRKACRILGLSASDLGALCRSYGRPLSYEV